MIYHTHHLLSIMEHSLLDMQQLDMLYPYEPDGPDKEDDYEKYEKEYDYYYRTYNYIYNHDDNKYDRY